MIDIVVPKKKNIVKPRTFHGHVCLDIHNTNSGSTERIEKENTVTTAADEWLWLNNLMWIRRGDVSGGATTVSSVYGTLYGGVCLFQDSISGNGNRLPFGSNPMLGYGGDSTTISGNRAYYNSDESSVDLENGIAVSVWDWQTNQANGTISSIARTHVKIGNGFFSSACEYPCMYGYISSAYSVGVFTTTPQDSTSSHFIPIGIDMENEIMYLYYDGYYYSCPYDVSLTNKMGSGYYYPGSINSMTQICATSLTGWTYERWYNLSGNSIYGIKVTDTDTITLYVANLSSASPSETTTTITLNDVYFDVSTNANYQPVISDGYAYVIGSDSSDSTRKGIYQINLTDNSYTFLCTSDIVSVSSRYPKFMTPWGTGGVAVQQDTTGSTTGQVEILINQDLTYMIGEPEFDYTTYNKLGDPFRDFATGADNKTPHLKMGSNGYSEIVRGGLMVDYAYLGTYCNLDEAVTKTSAQTLKLTYTLTDAT